MGYKYPRILLISVYPQNVGIVKVEVMESGEKQLTEKYICRCIILYITVRRIDYYTYLSVHLIIFYYESKFLYF
jgi:hypothetical protein